MPGHQIPLATFVRTSQQTEAVLRGLSRELFGDELQFDLVVLPPDDGTFLTRLGLILSGVAGAFWLFLESDIGKGFVKGLTDQQPAYWSEALGRELKTSIEHAPDDAKHSFADDYDYGARIVSEMTTSFLRKSTDELARIGITPGKFRDAFEARNQFYHACSETPELRAVGFSEEPNFPIQRSDFVRLQVSLPPPDDEDDHPWFVATVILKVTSPNWDRHDRARKWKGRDLGGRDRHFSVEDKDFWHHAVAGTISTHIIDEMKVQWAFQGKPDQPRNCRVLRVLEFNGLQMSEPLSVDELQAALGRLGELPRDRWDLFDDQRDDALTEEPEPRW